MREIRLKRKNNFRELMIKHIYENLKSYLIIIIILIMGIAAGVIFINNTNEEQIAQIQSYINNFIDSLKQDYHIDKIKLLKNSLWDNAVLTICMWFIGSTVIGIPIVLGIVLYRGFCIGYTVASIIGVLGIQKGLLFSLISILLQNIVFIPVIICMAVSCIKLYKSIMKDKRRENIKIEILRHTIMSFVLLLCLVLASLVEVYISSNLLSLCIKFF